MDFSLCIHTCFLFLFFMTDQMSDFDKFGIQRGVCRDCEQTDEPCMQYLFSDMGLCGYCGCPPTKHSRICKFTNN
jgi:hypothetical protein